MPRAQLSQIRGNEGNKSSWLKHYDDNDDEGDGDEHDDVDAEDAASGKKVANATATAIPVNTLKEQSSFSSSSTSSIISAPPPVYSPSAASNVWHWHVSHLKFLLLF